MMPTVKNGETLPILPSRTYERERVKSDSEEERKGTTYWNSLEVGDDNDRLALPVSIFRRDPRRFLPLLDHARIERFTSADAVIQRFRRVLAEVVEGGRGDEGAVNRRRSTERLDGVEVEGVDEVRRGEGSGRGRLYEESAAEKVCSRRSVKRLCPA
jgi:hypothetical protein